MITIRATVANWSAKRKLSNSNPIAPKNIPKTINNNNDGIPYLLEKRIANNANINIEPINK